MFKIKGYLKKFWYLILACICLLFVQAQTELTLPDYMSDIVSVGIQAGGFASPVSDVLTEETYQHLLLFVDQKDQKTVKKDYKKVSKVNQDIIDTFPKAKGKTVYQLKDLSSDEESELEDILMKPMLIITSLDSMDTSSKEYQEKFGQLPPNMSVFQSFFCLHVLDIIKSTLTGCSFTQTVCNCIPGQLLQSPGTMNQSEAFHHLTDLPIRSQSFRWLFLPGFCHLSDLSGN